MSFAPSFSGLPGETSHQTSSRPSAPHRVEADVPVPAMGRVERAAEEADARHGRPASMSREAPPNVAAKGVQMGGLDAVGDAVTGGLLGRAVEPRGRRSGRRRPYARDELPQLRRGAESGLIAPRAARRRMSTARCAAFFHDFLHGVFNFEGKIWRTLPMLAWRPGEMTRRYIAGERARFVSPIALVSCSPSS